MMTLSPEEIRKKLLGLVVNFEEELKSDGLRSKVLALVPAFHALRGLGKSLLPVASSLSGRDRILFYFRKFPFAIIKGDEFLVVSGIHDYPRRIRELRVQFGWAIMSGLAAREIAEAGEFPVDTVDVSKMKRDEYILISEEQDREAAFRWKVANEIRRKQGSVRDKILEFLKANVGKAVTGEELRYVANNRTEWARRVRELRSEMGWPVTSKNTGRPDLSIGTYVLESLRQSPEHDRTIPDPVRGAVLRRDGYKCTKCSWSHDIWNPSDARHLEIHHVKEHVKGGDNEETNLVTLCTMCHDSVHRKK